MASATSAPPFPAKISPSSSSSNILFPLFFRDSKLHQPLYMPVPCSAPPPEPAAPSSSARPAAVKRMGSRPSVKVSRPKPSRDLQAGPAFVGQVYSMCDLSGTGLMAVSTHFDIPFLSKRTPQWLKKMFAAVSKSERNGPVFRFFMDLGDAVSYVKKLDIPSGVVGACRLDLAFEHFKDKPHLFQFVPNEKQVKEANKLLKSMPQSSGCKKVEGVPVFSAENMNIAIATTDGIRWYTPYFFDKSTLDNILEDSVDQHFDSLIQSRDLQRRRDIIDDSLGADVVEEMGDSLDSPEVQEVFDEMGPPSIPLSVLSKAAEIELLYTVDKVLLGNRWLRKAAGIQPKFPYMVDSFEKRSTASLLRSYKSTNLLTDSNSEANRIPLQCLHSSAGEMKTNVVAECERRSLDSQIPFKDWLALPWVKQPQRLQDLAEKREDNDISSSGQLMKRSPLLPRITMVGISTVETAQMNKAALKKTMEDLTEELEKINEANLSGTGTGSNECKIEERDPLFVANSGDYAKTVSARLRRREA